VQHGEGVFRGACGRQIYHQSWLPESQARAVLLIIHGFGEHSGRFTNVVGHLVPLGYAIHALDHIGHGRSEGVRGHVRRFDDYSGALASYLEMVRGWQPGVPLFLFGHSMGCLVAATYLLDHRTDVAGCVFSGSSMQAPEGVSTMIVQMARLFSLLAPRARVAGIEVGAISRDPRVVQAYVTDPLVYTGKASARLGAELLRAAQRVMTEAATIRLPILLVHGGADRLAPVAGARAFYAVVGSEARRSRCMKACTTKRTTSQSAAGCCETSRRGWRPTSEGRGSASAQV
jgi:acylglycerol lipase